MPSATKMTATAANPGVVQRSMRPGHLAGTSQGRRLLVAFVVPVGHEPGLCSQASGLQKKKGLPSAQRQAAEKYVDTYWGCPHELLLTTAHQSWTCGSVQPGRGAGVQAGCLAGEVGRRRWMPAPACSIAE